MSRTSKIHDANVVDRIVSAVERGCTYSAAASAGPIAESTFYEWLRQAEIDTIAQIETEHTRFAARIADADSTAERLVTEMWFAQCPSDWRACRDFLARRHPARWGPNPAPVQQFYTPSDEEAAGAIADAMERWLQNREADV